MQGRAPERPLAGPLGCWRALSQAGPTTGCFGLVVDKFALFVLTKGMISCGRPKYRDTIFVTVSPEIPQVQCGL